MSMTYFFGLPGSTSTSMVSPLMYSLGSNQIFSAQPLGSLSPPRPHEDHREPDGGE